MQQESPRKCKICGGPNHHGCGCEARQRRAAVQVETGNIKSAEQPASEKEDDLEDILSPESIRKSQEANITMAKNIQTINDCFETVLVTCYDINNYLKLIAGDLITIRKHLTKEDEVKNAPENKD